MFSYFSWELGTNRWKETGAICPAEFTELTCAIRVGGSKNRWWLTMEISVFQIPPSESVCPYCSKNSLIIFYLIFFFKQISGEVVGWEICISDSGALSSQACSICLEKYFHIEWWMDQVFGGLIIQRLNVAGRGRSLPKKAAADLLNVSEQSLFKQKSVTSKHNVSGLIYLLNSLFCYLLGLSLFDLRTPLHCFKKYSRILNNFFLVLSIDILLC